MGLRCVYTQAWKPDPAQRGGPCGAPIPKGSKVPLCSEHTALKCEVCGSMATRRYQGKELCPKSACGGGS